MEKYSIFHIEVGYEKLIYMVNEIY
jgi:hypothetical protein